MGKDTGYVGIPFYLRFRVTALGCVEVFLDSTQPGLDSDCILELYSTTPFNTCAALQASVQSVSGLKFLTSAPLCSFPGVEPERRSTSQLAPTRPSMRQTSSNMALHAPKWQPQGLLSTCLKPRKNPLKRPQEVSILHSFRVQVKSQKSCHKSHRPSSSHRAYIVAPQ